MALGGQTFELPQRRFAASTTSYRCREHSGRRAFGRLPSGGADREASGARAPRQDLGFQT
jgi:hypothetical protein